MTKKNKTKMRFLMRMKEKYILDNKRFNKKQINKLSLDLEPLLHLSRSWLTTHHHQLFYSINNSLLLVFSLV